ncbi:MAG: glycosyltransferase family 4 protein [Prolixibacteraceae bacterium]|nr:glycosyltransferase family 4 protein [Prolixibacteraceae bacterium]
MTKTKIIYILCHPPHSIIKKYKNPEEYLVSPGLGDFIKIPDPPFWIGFFSKDHHAVAAEELMKITDEFEIECWRPYGTSINRMYTKEVNGITHRVFPSFSIRIPQVGSGNFSPQLFSYLKDYSKSNNVILNISVGHAWFHIWLLLKLRRHKRRIPVVANHISGSFKKFNFSQLPLIKKIFKWYYLIEHNIEKRSLKYVDYYLTGSMMESDYLKTIIPLRSSFYTVGVDHNYFTPGDDKAKIRKELGLPLDKKIMIVTGNFRKSDYGYHHLIECYKTVKSEYDDLLLIMVGGYRHEDLYKQGEEAGILMVERIPKSTLLQYYQASDFYGQPTFSYTIINFGGFGYSMMEALACGLPVLSQNIIHFPGTLEERNKIGLDMPTKEALVKNMIFLKDNFQDFKECRSVGQKYFDIEETKLGLLNLYKELNARYFFN